MNRIVLLACIIASFHVSAQSHIANDGFVDLRNFDFNEKGNIALEGEWEFYMSEIIDPAKFVGINTKPKDVSNFPSTWNETSKAQKPGIGFATYHLKILLKKGSYSLEIPHFYSNYALFVNQDLIAFNGKVGTDEFTSVPQWRPQTVSFLASTDTIRMTIQVSNFHHAKGGVREKILLGSSNNLMFKRSISITSTLMLGAVLLFLALSFFIIYIIKHDNAAILFAALCLTWGVRAAFSNLYILTYYYPDFPWTLSVKIEYLTLYLMMVWTILLLRSIFPEDVNRLFKYLFIFANLIFAGVTIFTSPLTFTQFLPVYLSFCGALLIYIIYVLTHAIILERPGVWLIVGALMVGVILFAYDLFAYQGLATFNAAIINAGYVVVFVLLGVCLSLKFGLLKRNLSGRDMLRYEDLYGPGKS